MCVDYTSLKKACPKVPFPFPRIDQIVDSTAGCELLCFLDAYSGYHQIKMKESNQLATSFITPFRNFDHPQNTSNLVCLTLVFIDLLLLSSFCILYLLLTLTGDGWLPLQETQTFLWMIQENFTGKGDVQHKLKGWKP
jgi:hypothetical protein